MVVINVHTLYVRQLYHGSVMVSSQHQSGGGLQRKAASYIHHYICFFSIKFCDLFEYLHADA